MKKLITLSLFVAFYLVHTPVFAQDIKSYKKNLNYLLDNLRKTDTLLSAQNNWQISDTLFKAFFNIKYIEKDTSQSYIMVLSGCKKNIDLINLNIKSLCFYSHFDKSDYKILDFQQLTAMSKDYADIFDIDNIKKTNTPTYQRIANAVYFVYSKDSLVLPIMEISFDSKTNKINSLFNMLSFANESSIEKMNSSLLRKQH